MVRRGQTSDAESVGERREDDKEAAAVAAAAAAAVGTAAAAANSGGGGGDDEWAYVSYIYPEHKPCPLTPGECCCRAGSSRH